MGETLEKRKDQAWVVGRLSGACEAEPLMSLFERIADEEGWQPDGELHAHLRRSVFFALELKTEGIGSVIGGIQLVMTDEHGCLPCHRVWPEADSSKGGTIAHIAIMAVNAPWRGNRSDSLAAFWLLAAEMWRHCVLSGIEEVWLEATPRVLKLYQRLGFPLVVRGDLRPHWGEPCYLASMTIREVAGALAQKAVRSETYRAVLAHAFRFAMTK